MTTTGTTQAVLPPYFLFCFTVMAHTHTHTHPAFIGENNRCELLHGIAAKQTGENVVNRCVAMITTFHEQMVESATQTPSGGERNNRPLLHTHTCPIERNRWNINQEKPKQDVADIIGFSSKLNHSVVLEQVYDSKRRRRKLTHAAQFAS